MTITKCQQEEKNVQEPFSRWKLQYLRKKGRAAAFWPFSESVPARVGRTHAVEGVDLDKNAIQRIECGKRFVTDIELRALAAIFKVPAEELLSEE